MALFVYRLPKLVVVVTPGVVPLTTPTPIFPSKVTPPVSPLVSTAFISRLLRAPPVAVPIFPVILASAAASSAPEGPVRMKSIACDSGSSSRLYAVVTSP